MRWEIFHHATSPLRSRSAVVVQSHVFAKSGAQGDPRSPVKGCSGGDPVAMVGFFIRETRFLRNSKPRSFWTCLVQMGWLKNHRTQLVFWGECNIKKKHFWWSNPLPRMPVATITSCGEKNPSHRWLQRWHFFYLPNIGERWVSVLKIAHLWVVKNQHPMIAMSQLHDFFHFSIQRFKNRAQMVQKKSQWSETSA